MILNILIMVVAAYCVMCLLLFFFQSRLIYFSEFGRNDFVTPRQAGMDYQEVTINAAGEKLHGWFVTAPHARGVVLFFHGNAGNISHRLDYLRMFRELGFSVFIFDYRGFGKSSGEPSEIGTYQDAEAAWNYLVETRRVTPSSIVLFGESLGGAVAAWLAARVRPRATDRAEVANLSAKFDKIIASRWLEFLWVEPIKLLNERHKATRKSLDLARLRNRSIQIAYH